MCEFRRRLDRAVAKGLSEEWFYLVEHEARCSSHLAGCCDCEPKIRVRAPDDREFWVTEDGDVWGILH
jgi:hypothetical protein